MTESTSAIETLVQQHRGSHPGLIAYGTSKGAVHSFTTRSAAALAAENIRVNAIAPGSIATDRAAALTDASDPQGTTFTGSGPPRTEVR